MQVVMYIGFAIAVFAQLWMLVRAFQESILWGLGMLLLPILTLFFLAAHWDRAKQPFLLNLLGIGLIIVGYVNAGPTPPVPVSP